MREREYLSELSFTFFSNEPTNCCFVPIRLSLFRIEFQEKKKKNLRKYVPVPAFRCTFKRLTIGMFGNAEHGIGSPSLRVSRKRRSLVSMHWQPVTRNWKPYAKLKWRDKYILFEWNWLSMFKDERKKWMKKIRIILENNTWTFFAEKKLHFSISHERKMFFQLSLIVKYVHERRKENRYDSRTQ